jgi:hypothetical protein
LGKEKADVKLEIKQLSRKQKVVWYFTLAINFLIILFAHKLVFKEKKEAILLAK